MKKWIAILWIAFVIWGCEPDPLPVRGVPAPIRTVVIGSQNLPDEFLALAITESFNALEGGRQDDYEELIQLLAVDSLDILVEVEGDLYSLVESEQAGLYLGTDVPQVIGAPYTLYFEHPFNGQAVSATATLQEFVGFDSLDIFVEINDFDSIVNVGLKLQDPTGPNWYMANVQLINEDFSLNQSPFTELFDDSGQDGELIEYEFRMFFRDYEPGDTVLVSMANISKDYYDFLDLLTTRRPFSGGIGEPITYPTNVKNGLGYFHMHLPDIRFFLPDSIRFEYDTLVVSQD